ncbi:MAG: hypothetical protein F6K11_30470 [Leptolyngbya sp. SIO3F4]|nr:hypothetical protein [Leptolyngbya sp. SIO3F4]
MKEFTFYKLITFSLAAIFLVIDPANFALALTAGLGLFLLRVAINSLLT